MCTIIEKEYDIPMMEELGEELRSMSNLGLGVREYGIEIGKEIGKEIGQEIGQIQGTINTCKILAVDKSDTKQMLMKQFSVSEEKADEYLTQYWE